MAIAVYNPPPGGSKALPANTVEKVIGIQLNTGTNLSPFWTVFGKVVVNNPSGSLATVLVQLVVGGTVLDASTATILASGSGSISVEGVTPTLPVPIVPMCVEITCRASANANAGLARLIAISVNPASEVTC